MAAGAVPAGLSDVVERNAGVSVRVRESRGLAGPLVGGVAGRAGGEGRGMRVIASAPVRGLCELLRGGVTGRAIFGAAVSGVIESVPGGLHPARSRRGALAGVAGGACCGTRVVGELRGFPSARSLRGREVTGGAVLLTCVLSVVKGDRLAHGDRGLIRGVASRAGAHVRVIERCHLPGDGLRALDVA